jgi:hypothetical protein
MFPPRGLPRQSLKPAPDSGMQMFLKTEVHDGKLEKSLPALKAQIQLDLVKAQRSDARYLTRNLSTR